MPHKAGSRNISPDSRIYSIISELCIVLDAIFIAGEVALRQNHAPHGSRYSLACSRFPLQVIIPISGPFYLAMLKNPVPTIYPITFEKYQPEPQGHTAPQLRTINVTVFCAFFVMFYERYRPWLQIQFGREVRDWPELFRFCWAIRNAAAHHEAHINFTNPTCKPVSWEGLTYSPLDNGKTIFGPNDLSVGDIFILLLEMSDELDELGAPI